MTEPTPHTCHPQDLVYQGVRENNGHRYELYKCRRCGYEQMVPTDYFRDTEWRR